MKTEQLLTLVNINLIIWANLVVNKFLQLLTNKAMECIVDDFSLTLGLEAQ